MTKSSTKRKHKYKIAWYYTLCCFFCATEKGIYTLKKFPPPGPMFSSMVTQGCCKDGITTPKFQIGFKRTCFGKGVSKIIYGFPNHFGNSVPIYKVEPLSDYKRNSIRKITTSDWAKKWISF